MSEQTGGFQPDTVLDACGLHCPLPLLKTKQALAALAAGQLLEVRSTDAGSWRDMAGAVFHCTGNCVSTARRGERTYPPWAAAFAGGDYGIPGVY